jgi:L-alanine-DL-glutamate epimerase-like enolase superfamily enzyme
MRRIESVDFFYLAMPHITSEGDGSQDALVVRVTAGGLTGWGECEASPLVSIAAFVCPMSHGACRPVADSVIGQPLESPADIAKIASQIAWNSMDLLQAPHTWSGIEMALWDLLGKARSEPVWKLLGYSHCYPKLPYASQLFGDAADETLQRARAARNANFAAVKFGWGPIGRSTLQSDLDHFFAAREGLGPDVLLMIDAGQVFGTNVEAAEQRLKGLSDCGVTWLEEPFHTYALAEYGRLSRASAHVAIAAGEGAHHFAMARNLIDFGCVKFIQIDTGRIGGIGPAQEVADFADARGITYVNHTFTSHLALSASVQPYAGLQNHRLCEFPFSPRPLAIELTANHIARDVDGLIMLPDRPGLGIDINPDTMRKYAVDVDIRVNGRLLFSSV